MKFETRVERSIDDTKHRLGIAQNIDGKAPSVPQTGEFLSLLPQKPLDDGEPEVSRAQRQKIDKARMDFFEHVSKCLPGGTPFSIFPCILSLPECIDDWPDFATFQRVLLELLSDDGFLFWEVYPTAKDQYSILDFVEASDTRKENMSCNCELWTETKSISHLQRKFEDQYRLMEQPENLLRSLEDEVGQSELFRRCILELVKMLQNGKEISNIPFYEEHLVKFCRSELQITDAQLYTCIEAGSIPPKRYEDLSLNSLKGALGVLSKVYYEFACELETEAYRLAPTAGKETYERYKRYSSTYKKLDDKLQHEQFLLYSSSLLLENIKEDLVNWYQHVDTEKCDRIRDSISENTDQDQQVRINNKRSADSSRCLPKYFDFAWNYVELDAIRDQSYDKIRQRLSQIFMQYWRQHTKEMSVVPDNLEEIVNHILVISFMEQFSLDDIYSNSQKDTPPTLAPVISYLIFCHCRTQIANGTLKRIPMKTLISPMKMQETPEKIARDLWLFSELCKAYGQYYKERCTEVVVEHWNAAFLIYSGYRKLYAKPNLFHLVESIAGPDQAPHPVLRFCCFEQIIRSLESNHVNLEHTALCRRGLPEFPPVPNDLNPDALAFFRALLDKDGKESQTPLLEQYESFLSNPYSHEGIAEFLDSCLSRLICSWNSEKAIENYNEICTQFDLYGGRGPSYAAMLLKAAIEYTMRNMLEEACAQRLYNWVTDYIDLRCKSFSSDLC